MGLDITVLRRASKRVVNGEPDADELWDDGYRYCHVNSDFVDRADGLESGYYKGEDQISFRAGSYSGYNEWREWLAQTMLGVRARDVWADAERFGEQPFYELINFADNEGIIAGQPAKRLAQAFIDHDDEAKLADTGWQYKLYELWREAFAMAADDGLVDFG